MKRGRERILTIALISAFVLMLLPLSSAGFFSNVWNKITGYSTNPVGLNITVGVTTIPTVTNVTVSLNAGPSSTVINITFAAYNGAGYSQINGSSGDVNLTNNGAGEVTRYNSSCYNFSNSGNYMNFTCNITLWWYDKDGQWNVSAYVWDTSGNMATNNSTTLKLPQVTGFNYSPGNLTWAAIGAGSFNSTSSNDPLLLNNTGNTQFGLTTGNISINATNLRGESNSTLALWAGNFSVSNITGNSCSGASCVECSANTTTMVRGVFTNISSATLPKGNYTVNDNVTGQEQLFFCLRYAGSELTAQSYSTANETGTNGWTIQTWS